MKKTRFSEEQIATALRQVDTGTAIPEVTRALGISEATYHMCGGSGMVRWRLPRFGGCDNWRRSPINSNSWWPV